jgi:hypothetical protein
MPRAVWPDAISRPALNFFGKKVLELALNNDFQIINMLLIYPSGRPGLRKFAGKECTE